METQYRNITLYKVEQSTVLSYLSSVGLDSYISPSENDFVTVYDSSFDVISSYIDGNNDEILVYRKAIDNLESMIDRNPNTSRIYMAMLELYRATLPKIEADLRRIDSLDDRSGEILKQYSGAVEGSLVVWASHLSKQFSCSAIAINVQDNSRFWYHLSQNGSMVDEYTTYAGHNWQPGQPILTGGGYELKGGDARKLCIAFGKEHKLDDVNIILRKPSIYEDTYDFHEVDYEFLLQMSGFPDAVTRHRALAIALEMPIWWVLNMSYSAIIGGDAECFFDDESGSPPKKTAMSMLKQAQPTSVTSQ